VQRKRKEGEDEMSKQKTASKKSAKTPIDPRIANVLARFDEWASEECLDNRELGRYVTHLLDQVEWANAHRDKLRKAIEQIAGCVYEEELDHMDEVADTEHEVFLQCTVGNEATEALQKCGLRGFDAEAIVHKAISDALKAKAQTKPVAA
jgi:hypothetical protein